MANREVLGEDGTEAHYHTEGTLFTLSSLGLPSSLPAVLVLRRSAVTADKVVKCAVAAGGGSDGGDIVRGCRACRGLRGQRGIGNRRDWGTRSSGHPCHHIAVLLILAGPGGPGIDDVLPSSGRKSWRELQRADRGISTHPEPDPPTAVFRSAYLSFPGPGLTEQPARIPPIFHLRLEALQRLSLVTTKETHDGSRRPAVMITSVLHRSHRVPSHREWLINRRSQDLARPLHTGHVS
jgi:hypothetical protein